MFLKLVKHELKATYKIFLQMILGFLIMTAINIVIMIFLNKRNDAAYSYGVMGGAISFAVGLWILSFIAISIASFILLIRRFYVSMVGKGAYLSYTLPVSSYALVGAKLLVANIWTLLVQIVLFMTSIFMVLTTVSNIIGEIFQLKDVLEAFRIFARAYPTEYQSLISFFYLLFLMIIISNVYGIVSWYFASVVGMQAGKYKVGVMILTIIGLSFVMQIVGSTLFMKDNLDLLHMIKEAGYKGKEYVVFNVLEFQKLMFLKAFIFTLVLSIINFIATGLIVKHKPNIT